MSDLIDRQKTLEKIYQLPIIDRDAYEFYRDVRESIKSMPSAQPDIIRCKDCEWCVEHYDTDGNAPYWICKNWDGGTDADGFCYEAERRIDE